MYHTLKHCAYFVLTQEDVKEDRIWELGIESQRGKKGALNWEGGTGPRQQEEFNAKIGSIIWAVHL